MVLVFGDLYMLNDYRRVFWVAGEIYTRERSVVIPQVLNQRNLGYICCLGYSQDAVSYKFVHKSPLFRGKRQCSTNEKYVHGQLIWLFLQVI